MYSSKPEGVTTGRGLVYGASETTRFFGRPASVIGPTSREFVYTMPEGLPETGHALPPGFGPTSEITLPEADAVPEGAAQPLGHVALDGAERERILVDVAT
jgi:hypothetical protein